MRSLALPWLARRSQRRRLLAQLLVLAGAACWPRRADAQSPGFRVVAHAKNPAGSVPRDFLSDAFLKKTSRWPDGEALQPVDQRGDAALRRAFSAEVLKRSVSAVKMYWQQRIFSGRGVPPPELDGDAAVISYVAGHRGAVGYVSEGAKLDQVKVLSIR